MKKCVRSSNFDSYNRFFMNLSIHISVFHCIKPINNAYIFSILSLIVTFVSAFNVRLKMKPQPKHVHFNLISTSFFCYNTWSGFLIIKSQMAANFLHFFSHDFSTKHVWKKVKHRFYETIGHHLSISIQWSHLTQLLYDSDHFAS